jgi:glycosyltransferase involved in cell wall biosynthesis
VQDWPSLAVIIPAAHAAGAIGAALESIEAQDYPNLESVIVAAYDQDTAQVAAGHGARVVANPAGSTPVGLNIALQSTEAEVIARVDAHSVLPPGYLTRAVETLLSTGADSVGGMQIPAGTTFWQKAIGAAMASRFGAGDARYRIGGEAGPADTVYLGVFRRKTLIRHGGYDERFDRNQDYELNHRIRAAGGVVWFDPALLVEYRPRDNLGKLARQYLDYGRWKRAFSRTHPGSLRWRQLAPPSLVVLLALAIVVGFWWPPAWLIPAAYVAVTILIGVLRLPGLGVPALGIPPALATMHISWGLGFLFA